MRRAGLGRGRGCSTMWFQRRPPPSYTEPWSRDCRGTPNRGERAGPLYPLSWQSPVPSTPSEGDNLRRGRFLWPRAMPVRDTAAKPSQSLAPATRPRARHQRRGPGRGTSFHYRSVLARCWPSHLLSQVHLKGSSSRRKKINDPQTHCFNPGDL